MWYGYRPAQLRIITSPQLLRGSHLRSSSSGKSPVIALFRCLNGANGHSYYPALGPTDEDAVKKHAADLEKHLAVYDGILSKQAYLAGAEISVADIFHLPYIKIAKSVGFKEIFDKFPHVAKWAEGLEARESWVKVIA